MCWHVVKGLELLPLPSLSHAGMGGHNVAVNFKASYDNLSRASLAISCHVENFLVDVWVWDEDNLLIIWFL